MKQEKTPRNKLVSFIDKIADGVEEMLFPEIKMFAEIVDDEEDIKTQVTEKELYLLCDQALVKIKMRAEKESFDDRQKITCEVLEIDDVALDPIVSESAEILPEMAQEKARDLLVMTIKNSGLSTERIVPVTDRYVESRKKILRLEKSIMKGGNNDY